MTADRDAVATTVDRVITEVGEWPHVTVGDHRFGGTEFRVGPREIGHIHAWGMLDIAFLKRLRDVLVADIDVESELAALQLILSAVSS